MYSVYSAGQEKRCQLDTLGPEGGGRDFIDWRISVDTCRNPIQTTLRIREGGGGGA